MHWKSPVLPIVSTFYEELGALKSLNVYNIEIS